MSGERAEKCVQACLRDNYGLQGDLKRLPGENLNYLVTTGDGRKFVAKIVDDHMPPAVVEMECAAIEHARKAGFGLELPGIVRNSQLQIESGIIIRSNEYNRLRLIEFIEGDLLDDITDISINLAENVGRSLARFQQAMKGFDTPAAHRSHRWNLAEAGRHRDKVALVEEPGQRELLTWAFDGWQAVEQLLPGLPSQFIHGDANRENILVRDGRVSGLLDFGDACHNPAICDLAICLAYLMMDRPDPLETAAAAARGFHGTRRLTGLEIRVLHALICARLAVSVAVSTARRRVDPENPNWFGGEAAALDLLSRLASIGPGRFGDVIRSGLRPETAPT